MPTDPLGIRPFPVLDPVTVRAEVRRFLDEDVGPGDLTTELVVPAGCVARGAIVAREPLVVAGLDIARAVFLELDARVVVDPLVADGARVPAASRLATISGPARPILTGERVALNLLQRVSGIATATRRYADAVAGTGASVSDTRKTTPGLRLFEKYAVRIGGGRNHRVGLFDAVLIKDNHIAAAGGIVNATRAALCRTEASVQVEVDSLDELEMVLDLGVRAVLLDNMTPEETAAAVRLVRAHRGGTDCWIESSGGVTLSNIRAYAEAGVDTISVGALTHSARAVDIALDLDA